MKKTITIVDYGSGNLLSAQQSFIKALSSIGVDAEIQISNNPKNLELSSHVVLPGQEHLKPAWTAYKKIPGMEDELNKFVKIKQKTLFWYLCWNAIVSRQQRGKWQSSRFGLD